MKQQELARAEAEKEQLPDDKHLEQIRLAAEQKRLAEQKRMEQARKYEKERRAAMAKSNPESAEKINEIGEGEERYREKRSEVDKLLKQLGEK